MNKGTINYLCKIGLSKVKYDDDIFVYYYTTIQHCIKLFYKIKFFSYLPTHFLKPLLPETHLYFFWPYYYRGEGRGYFRVYCLFPITLLTFFTLNSSSFC